MQNYENFKKVLDMHGDKIAEIIQYEDKLISNLLDWGRSFEDNIDILSNAIEKLLNSNLENVLPRKVFLSCIDDKKEKNINDND